jgi:hypothetical protein
MKLQSRIQALAQRHASLEERIEQEDNRPRPDGSALTQLKLQKLRLKQEMERLRASG